MRVFAILTTLLPLLAHAAHNQPPYLRHRRIAAEAVQHVRAEPKALVAPRANIAHSEAHNVIKRAVKKRSGQCRARSTSSSSTAPAATSAWPSSSDTAAQSSDASQPWSSDASQPSPAVQAWAQPSKSTTWSSAAAAASSPSTSAWSAPSSSSAAAPASASGSGAGAVVNGLLSITDATCGWCDSSDSAPNGSEDWLNCGVSGGGWTPPYVTASQLVAADLDPSGVFSACSAYFSQFEQYAGQYGVPPIMLASFALQESSCNAGATGGNGEAGLMQIAPSNCNPPSGTSCWDVDYNIQRGAELFSNMISSNGGNVIAAVGSYNGWSKGMTYADATAEASEGDCSAQNNLDYLTQFFNGWMQGKSGSSLGTY
ncbi:hypothetical protein JCM24511_09373, partial [Saitozyma sp. JCM 24511]